MDFRRLFDILPYQQARFPNKAALSVKIGLEWICYPTADCLSEIDRVSAGLIELGLKRGDTFAILSHRGSPKWTFLDFGLQQIGAIPVPVHASCTPAELRYIFREAGIRYCMVADRELYEKVEAERKELPLLQSIYSLQELPEVLGWEDLAQTPSSKHLAALQGLRASIHEEDLATIIYTSGSTGQPKGVMLSHKNIVTNIKATIALMPINYTKRAVSFLPMSHIFERMVTYAYMAVGASVNFAWQRDDLLAFIKEVRPHYFTVVPRFLEKVYDNIQDRISDGNYLTKRIGRWAIRVGERYRLRGKMTLPYWFQLRLANLLVFSQWRRQLGGQVEGLFVGSAMLQPRLARLFTAARIRVKEGYGLTETSPVIAFNRFEPGGTRLGTVGLPIPGIEVRIDQAEGKEDGEIQVRGPGVMMGYYQKETATKAAFTEDGWFKTGDVGSWAHKRFLTITGRQKDIFKTSSGKYVAPEAVENHFKASPYIEQCLAIGFQRPYVATLLLPHFPSLRRWCEAHDIHWTAPQFMVLNHKVIQFYEQEIEKLNAALSKHQHSRNFHLLHEPWTPETGELTPTMKLRREVLLERFDKEIEEMYQ